MTRRQKAPLRALTAEEREHLTRLSRAQAEPAGVVACSFWATVSSFMD